MTLEDGEHRFLYWRGGVVVVEGRERSTEYMEIERDARGLVQLGWLFKLRLSRRRRGV